MIHPLKNIILLSCIMTGGFSNITYAQQTVAPPAKIETAPLAPPTTPIPSSPLPTSPVPTAPVPPVTPLVIPTQPLPALPIPQAVAPIPTQPQVTTPIPPNIAPTVTPPIIAPNTPPISAPTQPLIVTPIPQTAPVIVPEPAPESNILELTIEARPVLSLKNEASNEDGFATVRRDIARLTEEAKKAGIVITGKPFAVIDLTDEQRFKFEVMLPIEKPISNIAPAGLNFGTSPAGQAIRFKFTGAYEESAYVYESIEAYMEEKNIIARNYAIEEYLNDPKDGNDVELQMYIYYLKQ
jgi:effector-binding domain-containing protein